jgi:hypothetical protein
MATQPVTNPTLLDLANRMGADGKIMTIVELLQQQNDILDDIVWQEGNLPTGNKTKIRTGLPTPTWRKLYGGVQPTRSTSTEITDTTGMMEAFSEIDCVEADLNGNTSEFRFSEDAAHLQGMNHEFAASLFYGNEAVTPAKFTGFAPRMNALSGYEAAENVINGGGVGSDNASIYLVGWGPQTVFAMHPKGMPAGLQHEDLGKQLVDVRDASGTVTGKMLAYVAHYSWHCGLVVKDWRYIVRIGNIDKSALTANAATGADILNLMTQAVERIQGLGGVKPVFYVPRAIRSMMRQQIVSKVAQSTLSMDAVAGKPVVTFDGIPVRRVDALSADEAALV